MTETAAYRQIHTQILWNRLLAVVEEQAQTLVRTAFSTTVREAGDLSAGVFDRRGRMLAQAVTGTPGHVNAMAASVGFFLRKFPLATLQPGDVLLTNDPWHGTGHLNDFTVVTPVFRGTSPVALFAATSHIADVGGLGFGCSGNIGQKLAVFEPTHGSAPKYAGQHKVNPIATILAAKMMLDWLGEAQKAKELEGAVADVIQERKVLTYDMGGQASTLDMANAIAAKI